MSSANTVMSRDDISQVMHARGYTEGMKKPASNINVAIQRAVEQGLIIETPDGRYAPLGWGPETSDHEAGGRAQDQLVGGGDGDGEI